MINFIDIHPDITPVLQEHNIKETDLFNHASDLYIGCQNIQQAKIIKNGGVWSALSDIFRPQIGSDMDQYPFAVDISFGAFSHYIKQEEYRKNKIVNKH